MQLQEGNQGNRKTSTLLDVPFNIALGRVITYNHNSALLITL